MNQFGGNVSGPIPLWGVSSLKDPKLFFFFNMEVTRGNRPNGSPFVDVAHPDILTGDFRRLLRTATLAGSSCLYPGETTARPCQQGTVFRPGTIIRNQAGNIIGGQPYPNNTVPQGEWNQNAPAFLKLIGALPRTNGVAVPGGNNPELLRVFVQDQYRFRKRLDGKRFDMAPAKEGSGLAVVKSARGLGVGDIDNDGRLDVVMNNCDGIPTVLRNETKPAGHWLSLRLIGGPKSPRDAIGATVHLIAGGQRQRADVISGAGYCSQSVLRLHFGLGSVTKVDGLEIRWPSGAREKVVVNGVDRAITIIQGKGIAKPRNNGN